LEAILDKNGLKRWRWGRPWVFRDQVERFSGGPGDLVEVKDPSGRLLGTAFLSPSSRILLRRFTRGPLERPLEEELSARIDAALARRRGLEERGECMRLVYSEADGLPGLVVDRYGPVLVVQTLTAGMDRLAGPAADHLWERLSPRMILARNDPAARNMEGLPREVRVLRGERVERLRVPFGRVRVTVEPFSGQKTGLYLDQAPARRLVGSLAAGKRVLDLFCYQGGFTLEALAGGASSVLSVDASARALRILEEDARENGLPRPETLEANVFRLLPGLVREGERFDLIVLDPPAFAKNKAQVPGAERGYRELNRRCLQLLSPGGVLVTCSCSYNMDRGRFLEILRRAASDAGKAGLQVETVPPGRDHPVLLSLPESDYLKVYVLSDVEGTEMGEEPERREKKGVPGP